MTIPLIDVVIVVVRTTMPRMISAANIDKVVVVAVVVLIVVVVAVAVAVAVAEVVAVHRNKGAL
jgi:hypothetical protein